MRNLCPLALLLFTLLAGQVGAAEPSTDIFASSKALGRGLNLGNALEAPNEGEWGVTLKEHYFTAIKKAGFATVRLPVKWSNHAANSAPFTIDEKFFARVDWAIEQATKSGLNIIVNVHHYDEMNTAPDPQVERLTAFWHQIAQRYRDQPKTVYFELLNEPNSKLTDDKWNALFPKLLAVVRQSNPTRPVIIGPGFWNSIKNLDKLKLPAEDQNLIATFHYYLPFEFTHQGAPWQQGADKWKGRTWGTENDRALLAHDFAKAADWAKREQRPLFLGEFGVYSAAEMAQRAKWTSAVVQEAEKQGFPWCYWEFCSGFGAYDPQTDQWHPELLKALTP